MSVKTVRAFLAQKAPDIIIVEMSDDDSALARVPRAAENVPECFARTLLLSVGGRKILIVVRQEARLANRKLKLIFGHRAKLVGATEVQSVTGHPVDGVCPFGLPRRVPIYADISLQAVDEILLVAGSRRTVVRIAPKRLADLVGAEWIDVCQVAAEESVSAVA